MTAPQVTPEPERAEAATAKDQQTTLRPTLQPALSPARRTMHAAGLLTLVYMIWVVMNESFHWIFLVTGIPVALVTLPLTLKVTQIDFVETFYLTPLSGLRYLFFAVKEIVLAAIGIAGNIIRGDGECHYFEYTSDLEDDTLLYLLCNTITLTPGSVTLERNNRQITVLSVGHVEDAIEGCRGLERSIAKLKRR